MNKAKTQIMIVGTFHMRQSPDLFQAKLDDFTTSQRQQEIVSVVDALKKFQPSKIAVEVPKKQTVQLNEDFQSYVEGDFSLGINEVHQLGFRLAAELGHQHIYPIDWMEAGVATKGAGQVYEWAKEHQPELFQELFSWMEKREEQEQIEAQQSYISVLDMYLACNLESELKQHHRMYVNIARIGTEEEYIGMEWLLWWYQRNLIIFSHLAKLVESTEDRILLIIGSAHVNILQNFLSESELFDVVPAYDYLHADAKTP